MAQDTHICAWTSLDQASQTLRGEFEHGHKEEQHQPLQMRDASP